MVGIKHEGIAEVYKKRRYDIFLWRHAFKRLSLVPCKKYKWIGVITSRSRLLKKTIIVRWKKLNNRNVWHLSRVTERQICESSEIHWPWTFERGTSCYNTLFWSIAFAANLCLCFSAGPIWAAGKLPSIGILIQVTNELSCYFNYSLFGDNFMFKLEHVQADNPIQSWTHSNFALDCRLKDSSLFFLDTAVCSFTTELHRNWVFFYVIWISCWYLYYAPAIASAKTFHRNLHCSKT